MNKSVFILSQRLQKALDNNYNVVDMATVLEIITLLERNPTVTREELETTRLAKFINELRRKTKNDNLARRSKNLLRKWRDMVMPAPAPVIETSKKVLKSMSLPPFNNKLNSPLHKPSELINIIINNNNNACSMSPVQLYIPNSIQYQDQFNNEEPIIVTDNYHLNHNSECHNSNIGDSSVDVGGYSGTICNNDEYSSNYKNSKKRNKVGQNHDNNWTTKNLHKLSLNNNCDSNKINCNINNDASNVKKSNKKGRKRKKLKVCNKDNNKFDINEIVNNSVNNEEIVNNDDHIINNNSNNIQTLEDININNDTATNITPANPAAPVLDELSFSGRFSKTTINTIGQEYDSLLTTVPISTMNKYGLPDDSYSSLSPITFLSNNNSNCSLQTNEETNTISSVPHVAINPSISLFSLPLNNTSVPADANSNETKPVTKKRGRKKLKDILDQAQNIQSSTSLFNDIKQKIVPTGCKKVKTTKELLADLQNRKYNNGTVISASTSNVSSPQMPLNSLSPPVSPSTSFELSSHSMDLGTSSANSIVDKSAAITKSSNVEQQKSEPIIKQEELQIVSLDSNKIINTSETKSVDEEIKLIYSQLPSINYNISLDNNENDEPFCSCTIHEEIIDESELDDSQCLTSEITTMDHFEILTNQEKITDSVVGNNVDSDSVKIDIKEFESFSINSNNSNDNNIVKNSKETKTISNSSRVKSKKLPIKSIFDLDYDDDNDNINTELEIEVTDNVEDEQVVDLNKIVKNSKSIKVVKKREPVPVHMFPPSIQQYLEQPEPIKPVATKWVCDEDPMCQAKNHFNDNCNLITKYHIDCLHNLFIPNVNGSWSYKSILNNSSTENDSANSTYIVKKEEKDIEDANNCVPRYDYLNLDKIPKKSSNIKYNSELQCFTKFNKIKEEIVEDINSINTPSPSSSAIPITIESSMKSLTPTPETISNNIQNHRLHPLLPASCYNNISNNIDGLQTNDDDDDDADFQVIDYIPNHINDLEKVKEVVPVNYFDNDDDNYFFCNKHICQKLISDNNFNLDIEKTKNCKNSINVSPKYNTNNNTMNLNINDNYYLAVSNSSSILSEKNSDLNDIASTSRKSVKIRSRRTSSTLFSFSSSSSSNSSFSSETNVPNAISKEMPIRDNNSECVLNDFDNECNVQEKVSKSYFSVIQDDKNKINVRKDSISDSYLNDKSNDVDKVSTSNAGIMSPLLNNYNNYLLKSFNNLTNSNDKSEIIKNGEHMIFKEWYEVVQEKSYNDETLTILPYVVID